MLGLGRNAHLGLSRAGKDTDGRLLPVLSKIPVVFGDAPLYLCRITELVT